MAKGRLWGLLLAAALISGCAGMSQHRAVGAETTLTIAPEAPDGVIRATPMRSRPLDVAETITRIAFGSCLQQNEDQSIWTQIAADDPDLFLFLGDNVYGDVRSNDPALPELKTAYMRLAQSAPFAQLRAETPVLATWDDHDYGLNDAGADFRYKEEAQELFNYVWDTPATSPRRSREGIYDAWMVGEETGRRVQIIMLDTRYFRSELTKTDEIGAPGKERYVPDSDPAKTMLGETQWSWLEAELAKPADLRIIVSSIQVIAEGHGWEAWRTLPRERDRLYETIDKANAENVIILSGDRHAAALYQRNDVIDYPLIEATSSSLNLPAARWREESGETRMEDGPHRLGDMIYDANYGVVDIDWEAETVLISIRGEAGDTIASTTVDLAPTR